jgi:uncharacterized membrane protein
MNRFLQLVIGIATGIALSQAQRRRVMFVLTLGSIIMLFGGTFLLWGSFVKHPLFFAVYWLVCVWIVICVLLLAIYDLLQVMRRGREERAAARRNIFKDLD